MANDPAETYVRNLLNVQRLQNGVVADASALIRDLIDEMVAQLAKIDPTAPKSKRWRDERVAKWLKLIRADSREAFKVIHREVRQQLAEIGVLQGEWAASYLRDLSGVGVAIGAGPTGINIMKSVIDTDFVQGGLLKDFWKEQGEKVTRRAAQQIRIGIANGETIDDMIRRVRGRYVRRGVYEGGVMQISTRDAASLVRTATSHVVGGAHFRCFEANKDILDGYRYDATLDSRTTPICMALDGQEFEFDDPNAKRPPQHWGCRSRIVPVVSGVDDSGYGQRATETGPVKAGINYEQWLKQQSKTKQVEILGKGRAELFRSGKVSLRDMVRSDGSTVRVEELRAKG